LVNFMTTPSSHRTKYESPFISRSGI